MARSMRRAVKLVLLATVLATAGAGVYHFTSGGGTWFWRFFANGAPNAELVSDETPSAAETELSQSDMDAVASAWAGSGPIERDKRSATAERSAVDDAEVTAAEYVESVDAGDGDDRYAASEPAPVELPASTARGVTRGQEPKSAGDDSDAGGNDSDSKTGPINFGGRPSSDRAREAFDNGSAATAAPSSSSAGDRYGMSAAEPKRGPTDAPAAPSAVNPFASQTGPVPTKQLAASAAPVESSNLESPAASGRAGTSSPAEAIEFQPEEIRSASAAYRTTPDGGSDRRFGSSPETGDALSIQSDSFGTTGDGTGRPGERALEGPQKPALVIQKFAPPEIQVGKPAKFAVQVRNVGGQTAEDVVIRDEVPHGTQLVSTSPRAESDGSHLVWELGTLSTGEERTVEIQLMPIAEGEIGSVATVSLRRPRHRPKRAARCRSWRSA